MLQKQQSYKNSSKRTQCIGIRETEKLQIPASNLRGYFQTNLNAGTDSENSVGKRVAMYGTP